MKFASMLLAVSTGALVSLGLVAMISSEIQIGWRSQAGLQVIFCMAGLALAALIALGDYRRLRSVAWLGYTAALCLLVAVLIWGSREYRAMRWLNLGWGLTFQPSEVAKLALIVMLAWYGERHQRVMQTWWRGFVVPGLMVGTVSGLLILQPHYGTMVLLCAVSGAVLLVAGVRWLHLLPTAVVGVGVLAVLLLMDTSGRINRVLDFWNREAGSPGREQVEHAMRALGSGGVVGLGPGQGEYYGWVPLFWSDFILALIGEEFGLVGTLSVVLAFGLFVVAGVLIAWNARDMFGLLLASGLTLLIGLQAMINIGVVIDLLPNTGVAMPFLSKGGSGLLVILMMVGILFSIARTTARERVAEVDPVADLEEFGALQTS
jgi:cell division protein FtsW